MRACTNEELAWVAGIVEGEGTIRRAQGPRGRARWFVAVQMTDADVVRRLANVTGLGRVYGPYAPRAAQTKSVWAWHVSAREDVYCLLDSLYGWLGERRRGRAEEALLELPPLEPQWRNQYSEAA
jgi:hypothetical protein